MNQIENLLLLSEEIRSLQSEKKQCQETLDFLTTLLAARETQNGPLDYPRMDMTEIRKRVESQDIILTVGGGQICMMNRDGELLSKPIP